MSIENIRKAEKKAEKIVNDSKQKAQEKIRQAQKDANALVANVKTEAETEIVALKKKSNQNVKKEEKKIKNDTELKLVEVEALGKKNKKAAVKIIIDSVTKN
jgi:vacuolar-type H+-ATPase subunit H